MDKEKFRKKIAIINGIDETVFLAKTCVIPEGEGGHWDIQNSDVDDLPYEEFSSFIENDLSRNGAIRLTGKERLPARDKNGIEMFNNDGTLFDELSMYFYDQVDVEKLLRIRDELVRHLNRKDQNDNLLKTQAEAIFLNERQLCLFADRKKCYSPQHTSNRIKYLKAIIDADGRQLSAKKLRELYKGPSFYFASMLSGEIKKMNKSISKNLGVDAKFILGNEGYRLNKEDYIIIKD